MKPYLPLLVLVFAALGCTLPVADWFGTRELDTVLAYGEGVFEPDAWFVLSTTDDEQRTGVFWESNDFQAVASFQHMHLNRPVTQAIISRYMSTASLDLLMSNYDHWQETDRCQQAESWIVEIDAQLGDEDYQMRMWLVPLADSRLLAAGLTFPETDVESLDRYSALLFPNFPSCEAA